jgi:hypothetical protein
MRRCRQHCRRPIDPLTVVERLLLPTVSWFAPSEYVPAPSIEPAVI